MTDFQYETEEGLAFAEQNTRFVAGLTADELGLIDQYAEHHSGGLIVLGREMDGDFYVKAHDSWGPGTPDEPGNIVVHVYDREDIEAHDVVTYFNDGKQALQAFLSADLPPIFRVGAAWHRGDVVQTQVPYDDFPITIVRDTDVWRATHGADPAHGGATFNDADIQQALADGIAIVKIQQDHQWHYTKSFKAFGPCALNCGADAGPEPVEQEAPARNYITLGEFREATKHLPDDMPITAGGIADCTPEWLNLHLPSPMPTVYDPSGETGDVMSLVLDLSDDFDTRQW